MSPRSPAAIGCGCGASAEEFAPGKGGGGGDPTLGKGGGGGAPTLGIGGGGGAPVMGMGGGGGAPSGAPPNADPVGSVGGAGALSLLIDGPAVGVAGLSLSGVFGLSFSSIAERGRGGPIVPKRMDARCLAVPPEGRSDSSSDESSLESTTDHSSSSGRTREGRCPLLGVEERGGK